jgi:hypothetical protein
MPTGSDTRPVQPSRDLLCQNFFSRRSSSKYSFGANSKIMETDLGSPFGTSVSKCETERERRELRSSALSEGWMYWSMSGGACSSTRGQKLGICESVFERRV